ncbi:TonB family protein [Methylotenera sp. N17]|uniref:TonB family protein n=1 Tax=Methylotenera sp. N17 TaxID=1502761 RepID=UPI000A7799CC|nr:TonB family protein [Methylotenera sp. N17]
MPTYHQSFLVTTQDNEDQSLVWALFASMLLHIAIAYVFPYFNQQSLQPRSTSIQIELNPLPEQPTSAATQPPAPPVSQAEPQPEEQPKPPIPIPPTPVTKPLKTKTEHPVIATPTPVPDPSYQVPVEPQTETPPDTQEETPPVQTSPNTTPATANPTPIQTKTAPTNTEKTRTSTTQDATARSSEVATSDEVWDGYGKALAAMVNKLKQYPTIAIRRHLEGEVQVIASFRQGKLISVELAEASQHQVLNEEAMRTIKKAIEQVALNANLERKTFTVTIPVGFKLE